MENKQKFIQLLEKNLKANGFPSKRVSFDIEKIYGIADKFGLSFNSLQEDLEKIHIQFDITTEKIIFSTKSQNTQDMFSQAQEMLSKMSPEEIENIKKMYENMSQTEKEQILQKAQEMGLK